MKKFFIDFNQTKFLETSTTSAVPNRLNWRCELLLTQHQQLIQGKRVLDIGSHDGRFAHACLELGASQVVGVEGRTQLVEKAEQNLSHLGFDANKFEFVCSDIFEYLQHLKFQEFEVIICCGFLYHTVRQVEFFAAMKKIQPETLIIDSAVCKVPPLFKLIEESIESPWFNDMMGARKEGNWHKPGQQTLEALIKGQYFVFIQEDSQREGSTIEPSGIVAIPSEFALKTLLTNYGFSCKKIDWKLAGITDWEALEDYENDDRVSYLCQIKRIIN
jgi:2-polyprenyl-3-methyl-5-hydroxy-6-metoxy-1,4-benzoquinol methylase